MKEKIRIFRVNLRIYSLKNFNVQYIAVLTTFIVLYVISLLFINLITGSLYLLICLIYFSSPPTSLRVGNHLFILCIYESVSVFCVCSFLLFSF